MQEFFHQQYVSMLQQTQCIVAKCTSFYTKLLHALFNCNAKMCCDSQRLEPGSLKPSTKSIHLRSSENSLPKTMDGLAPERKGWPEVWKRFPLRWPFCVLLAISCFFYLGWRSSWFNLIPRNVLGRSLYTNIQFNKITRFRSRQWKSVTHLSRLYMPHVRWHRILDSKQTYTTPVTSANLFALCWAFIYSIPIGSMYGVFTNFRLVFIVNVSKYIPGSYGIWQHYVFPSDLFFLILPLAAFFWCSPSRHCHL